MADVEIRPWGASPDGDAATLATLRGAGGMEARITNYGARLVSLIVPDRSGRLADVVLGFDDLAGYLGDNPYFGALVGRYANRIAGGRFALDGRDYALDKNSGGNTLHGGKLGFERRWWGPAPADGGASGVALHYFSPDGDQGFPGNLSVTVVYTLLEGETALRLDYVATAAQPTVVNLSNHSYFNLAGEGRGDILDCELTVNADRITVVDAKQIPTGELRDVAGTPFDFRAPRRIGAHIHDTVNDQIKIGLGYDENFVLNREGAAEGELLLAARVVEPAAGRTLEVHTTQPGLQLYTGGQLDGKIAGKQGHRYGQNSAVVLETQHFPDSVNHAEFPSTVLRPGEVYRQSTVYRFGVA